MKLNFDLEGRLVIEFGVVLGNVVDPTFIWVPVDAEVQSVLQGMFLKTWQDMNDSMDGPAKYEPSESYESPVYLYVTLSDVLAERFREFYRPDGFRIDSKVIRKPTEIYCYIAQFTDEQDRRLIAIRKSTQFTSVYRQKFIFLSDALHLVKRDVFKLDADFDLLVDSETVHIWRPKSFEYLGDLQETIFRAVPSNIEVISKDLPFVEFENIEDYASSHARAARYLASIKSHELSGIERQALEKYCEETNVEFECVNGKLLVTEKFIPDFLRVLDRRRYGVPFVPGAPEIYNASGRKISH